MTGRSAGNPLKKNIWSKVLHLSFFRGEPFYCCFPFSLLRMQHETVYESLWPLKIKRQKEEEDEGKESRRTYERVFDAGNTQSDKRLCVSAEIRESNRVSSSRLLFFSHSGSLCMQSMRSILSLAFEGRCFLLLSSLHTLTLVSRVRETTLVGTRSFLVMVLLLFSLFLIADCELIPMPCVVCGGSGLSLFYYLFVPLSFSHSFPD